MPAPRKTRTTTELLIAPPEVVKINGQNRAIKQVETSNELRRLAARKGAVVRSWEGPDGQRWQGVKMSDNDMVVYLWIAGITPGTSFKDDFPVARETTKEPL